ncbi:MAG: branched-chain amino acid ABC transporter permease [Burkholderiaceae bacterium]|nr:branched-chain amino acid ABC transporter permease [Burkholderiaceae bacterium]
MNPTRPLLQHPALPWGTFALVLAALPWIAHSDFALSVATKACIAIVFALSYNMLLGQGGMLSFGHAVYSGLGAYFTIHALRSLNQGAIWLPVSLLPVVGGVAGLGFALLLGWVSTRRAGTTFAMISLGIAELVAACVLMLPAFFGGEAGVNANRVTGQPWLGIDFGSTRQTYGLVATWTLLCAAAMFGITRTPFGRMANAVRDNPERVAFIGYSTHRLRYQLLVMAGFFAGIAGGLGALADEIVTIESVGAHASGVVLLMVFIGGAGVFFGPIIGALIVVLLQSVVSTVTPAWPFYFGLLFLAMVVYVPGGFASLVVVTRPQRRHPHWLRRLAAPYGRIALAALLLVGAAMFGVESAYRRFGGGDHQPWVLGGLTLDASGPLPWLLATALLAAGVVLMRSGVTRTGDAASALGTELAALALARRASEKAAS